MTSGAVALPRNGRKPGFIIYEDAASTANKVNYVLGERGFGGVFMWNLEADYNGTTRDLLNAMYVAFRRHQK